MYWVTAQLLKVATYFSIYIQTNKSPESGTLKRWFIDVNTMENFIFTSTTTQTENSWRNMELLSDKQRIIQMIRYDDFDIVDVRNVIIQG